MDDLYRYKRISGIIDDEYSDDEIQILLRELFHFAEVCYEHYSINTVVRDQEKDAGHILVEESADEQE